MMSSSRQAGGDGQTDQCGSAPGIRRTGLVPSRASSSDSFASCFSTRQPGAGLIAASFALTVQLREFHFHQSNGL